ncbi:MAG: hypothetical protein AB7F36_03840 [Reyranellaceae bacterium]
MPATTFRTLALIAAVSVGVAVSLAGIDGRAQAPFKGFLLQPFEGIDMNVTSLDVATGGDIVLAALLANGPHLDPGVRIVRYDAAGRRLWERNPAPRAELTSTAIARATGVDGTLVLLDETPKEQPQLTLLRLNGAGNVLWRRELGPGAASDLLVGPDGGAVVSGSVGRERSGGIEALVMAVSSDGLPVWRRRFSGDAEDGGNSADMLRMADGNAPLVGGLADIAYDDRSAVVAARGTAMKLRPDGQPAWRLFFGDGQSLTMVGGVAPGPIGDAYVLTVTEAAGASQFLELVRLRTDGSIAWRRPIAGPADQEINDMVALPGGGIAMVGSEAQGEGARSAILVLLDGEGIERARVNYRGYKMRRALMLRRHPAGGFVILFEGPERADDDATTWLGRVDAEGRF